MTTVGLIPARFSSSRFPGKPLVEILGVPMIVRVARIAGRALGDEQVVVATDDQRIVDVVEKAGYRAVLTSARWPTGTDRIAEAIGTLEAEFFLNIQGDEPMLDPEDIRRIAARKVEMPGMVINGMCPLSASEDPHNVNTPKVVCSSGGRLLYMSRSAIPGMKSQGMAEPMYRKQVCIYGFTRQELLAYQHRGRCDLERFEDIEILRFLDLGIPVQMIELSPGTLAVDIPADVATVEAAMRAQGGS